MTARTNSQRGQTVLLYTMAVSVLFGMLGLVVDIGWAYYRKQVAQAAADAAAQAAGLAAYAAGTGTNLNCSTPGVACWNTPTDCPSDLTSAANNMLKGCQYAGTNGFTTGGRIRVSLQSGIGAAPTATGVVISYWTVARVTERLPQLFSAVLGNREAIVAARAATGVRQGSTGGCVFTMNPTLAGSLSLNGTTTLRSGCGVFVNSNNAGAVNVVGGGAVQTLGDARTQIVGNWTGSGTITPAPQTGMPVGIDPFYDMEPPAVGSCQSTGISLGSHESLRISPATHGVICGPVNLDSHAVLNMDPGLYVIKGQVSLGGQASLIAHGATLYLPTAGINMAGGTVADLTAPSSGTWQGILIYQARGNTTDSTLVGGGAQSMNGVLYFPSAHLNYTGGSDLNATATTIVSDTLTMVGNSYISAAATTQYTGIIGGVFLID